MSLKILSIINKNNGNPDQEVVRLKCDFSGTHAGSYAIEDKTYNQGKLSNLRRNFFILPDIEMAGGDILNVYTGKPPKTFKLKKIGEYDHYLGLESCIWNNTGDTIELFRISSAGKASIKDVTE